MGITERDCGMFQVLKGDYWHIAGSPVGYRILVVKANACQCGTRSTTCRFRMTARESRMEMEPLPLTPVGLMLTQLAPFNPSYENFELDIPTCLQMLTQTVSAPYHSV